MSFKGFLLVLRLNFLEESLEFSRINFSKREAKEFSCERKSLTLLESILRALKLNFKRKSRGEFQSRVSLEFPFDHNFLQAHKRVLFEKLSFHVKKLSLPKHKKALKIFSSFLLLYRSLQISEYYKFPALYLKFFFLV